MEEAEDFGAKSRSRSLLLIFQDNYILRVQIGRLLGKIHSSKINITWKAVEKRLRSLEIYPGSPEYQEVTDAWQGRLERMQQEG